MPLVGFPSPRVRDALKQPISLGADLVMLLLMGAVLGGLIMTWRQWGAPTPERMDIDLSLWVLPGYTLLSLGRGLIAYVLSLVFTLVYGTIAAHNRRAERLMIPALDVLQAIPVLGFMPGLVLAMITLFPAHQIGLEIACILMIFTGQVWNMTFSYHASLRRIPEPLKEVSQLMRFSRWQVFRWVEAPSAMIGLVWNSMMSMAGGWFFLMVNEAFTLKGRDYRLPGIGSYMNEAIKQGDTAAMIGAIVAMIVMIVAVDQILWRPLVVWSQRFKLEETADPTPPRSWMLDLLRESRLYKRLVQHFEAAAASPERLAWVARLRSAATLPAGWQKVWPRVRSLLLWALAVAALAAAAWGVWALVVLLLGLPLYDPAHHSDWLTILLALLASFVRTSAAVLLGAAWTLPVGIVIGLSRTWSERLQPIIQVVASFPAPMLFPLLTLLVVLLNVPFDIGCVALMLLGAQWYILFNVIAGARAIPDDLKEVNAIYRSSAWQRWTKLYIPCVFPYLVTGLITAAGGAWNATIVSEYVLLNRETFQAFGLTSYLGRVEATVTPDEEGNYPIQAFGLGSIISQATPAGQYSLLCAAVVTMALFVVLLNRFFWKRLYRLAEDRYGPAT